MDYIEEQLQRIRPDLVESYREALQVLQTAFKLRFTFSALLLREIVEKLSLSHGLGKNSAAATFARTSCKWIEAVKPSPFFHRGDKEPEELTLRGHLLLSSFIIRPPSDFSPEQQNTIYAAIDRLVATRKRLSDRTHDIIGSSQLSEAEGRPLIDEVLHTLEEVLRLKRTILDIIELRFSDSASIGIGILDDGDYSKE